VPTYAFTIAKLADAAGVGVETVRYYQRRGLLKEAGSSVGAFREYSPADVLRLQFIKRAQELGFTLDDVAELISLSGERDKRRVREVTTRRLAEIQQRIGQLNAMASALQGLVGCCERAGPADACPIIAALAGEPLPATKVLRSRETAGSTHARSLETDMLRVAKSVAA
jgi:DNA-binding transcriptional MerR regulator